MRMKIENLFSPDEHASAYKLLNTSQFPRMELLSEMELERIASAALKLSGGSIRKLATELETVALDWRDVLVAAGFEHHALAHKKWLSESGSVPNTKEP